MRMILTAVSVSLAIGLAAPAIAQTSSSSGSSMPGMGAMKGMSGGQEMAGMGPMTPTQHEQMMAMQRMNEKMMAVTDSNPDRAFAKKMMAHHEGAIAMSEIELKMGKDAQAKRLAQKTITENRKGVSELQAFLSEH